MLIVCSEKEEGVSIYVEEFLIFSGGFGHVKVETCTGGDTRQMKLMKLP